jgi:hypothetical protein
MTIDSEFVHIQCYLLLVLQEVIEKASGVLQARKSE